MKSNTDELDAAIEAEDEDKRDYTERPSLGNNAGKALQGYIERALNCKKEIKQATEDYVAPLREDLKALYSEAAGNGFDKDALKELVRRAELEEEKKEMVEIYADSLELLE